LIGITSIVDAPLEGAVQQTGRYKNPCSEGYKL